MPARMKVGDRVTIDARVRRVDPETFTIQIGHLTPITLPHDHEAVISVQTDKAPPKPPKRPRKPTREDDVQIAGVRSDDIEFVRCNLT